MTNDKFKPTFKQSFIPQTETRIFLGGRPIDQQAEQTGSKGISKQPYQSARIGEINPGCGPGFWDDVGDWVDKNAPAIALRTSVALVSIVNPPAGVALAAGMTGGGVVARVAGEISDNDTARDTGRVLISGSSDRLSEKAVDKAIDVMTNLNK